MSSRPLLPHRCPLATRLAARLLGTPLALVTVLDAGRQFCKSAVGIDVPPPLAPAPSFPFSHPFCQHVVASGRPLVVADVREHPVHRENPAIQDIGAIAYAGVPLRTADGHVVGTFCAVDRTPRTWAAADVTLLEDLARAVVAESELRALLCETEAASSTGRPRPATPTAAGSPCTRCRAARAGSPWPSAM